MKKLLIAAAAASMLLASCASNGGAKKDAGAPAPEHPMTYVLDLYDASKDGVITFVDNTQYGVSGRDTRQAKPSWTKLVKPNRPQVGDTVRVTGRLTSNMDLDSVVFGLVDDCAAASYWTPLHSEGEDEFPLENIQAGVPFDIDFEYHVGAKMVQEFKMYFCYGEQNGGMAQWTVERVMDSDIGMTPPEEKPRDPNAVIDISRDLAFVEMKPEYPWENGVQNTLADPQHYQATVDITALFGDNLPKEGDVFKFTWKTKPSIDIKALKVRLVENTASVPGWWAEIDENPSPEGATVCCTDMKAYEPSVVSGELVFAVAPIEGVSLCITYDLDAGKSGCSLMFAN